MKFSKMGKPKNDILKIGLAPGSGAAARLAQPGDIIRISSLFIVSIGINRLLSGIKGWITTL